MTGTVPIEPFRVAVPDADLRDLHARLARTRWPEPATAPGSAHGIPLRTVQQLVHHWQHDYDWRATERRLNAVPQFLITIDGLRIHFAHVRSRHPGALPLILTHGWPGSVLEMIGLLGPLTDPTAHGGDAADAFDVVIPSLPGYGFSDRPDAPGWDVTRTARAWSRLMAGLGYGRYVAAGSDWGTSVSSTLAHLDSAHVAGIHLVPPLAGPDPHDDTLTAAEQAERSAVRERAETGSAYSELHRTAPQTLGYALTDSPVGQCAWIAEKMLSWSADTGSAGTPRGVTWNQILDQVSLYWFTGTAASSARLYAESIDQVSRWIDGTDVEPVVRVPTGASIFPAEIPRPSRRWAARRYSDIRYWAEHNVGGHFPALEVPELLIDDLRAMFSIVREADGARATLRQQ